MFACVINISNLNAPLWTKWSQHNWIMFNLMIYSTEVTWTTSRSQLLKYNCWNRTSEIRLTMHGKTLVLCTDGWIELIVGLNFKSTYSRQLCLFSTLPRLTYYEMLLTFEFKLNPYFLKNIICTIDGCTYFLWFITDILSFVLIWLLLLLF